MDKKPCRKCWKEFPLDNFFRSKRGLGGRRSWCKSCCLANERKLYSNNPLSIKRRNKNAYFRLKSFVNDLKSKPCTDCDKVFPAFAMEFDHVRGEKLGSIGAMRSKSKILSEAAKCEIVCVICHRIRTKAQRKAPSDVYSMARNMMLELKNKPCHDCGIQYPPEAMDYDHVRAKARNVSKMLAWPIKCIRSEINKCEVVCAVCHAIRTNNRREPWPSLFRRQQLLENSLKGLDGKLRAYLHSNGVRN